VGRGACTVIEHPSGRRSMIDINIATQLPPDERLRLAETGRMLEAAREEAALTHPVRWCWDRFGRQPVFRFVNTHPDLDHLFGVGHNLNGDVPTTCFWDLPHSKSCSSFRIPDHEPHWTAYTDWRCHQRSGQPVRVTQWRGADSYWFGTRPEYDHLEILWPTRGAFRDYDEAEDWNNMSVVIRAWHRDRSVLLPGDIEAPVWRALAEAEDQGYLTLKSDVLVASHHGRLSGYPPDGIYARIAPRAVIISTDKLPAAHNAARLYARAAEVIGVIASDTR
jgi:hypothetical protein